jgi:hypothetical protein
MVFVLSKDGVPLMPCGHSKARKLLRSEKAIIIKRIPLQIQLVSDSDLETQDIELLIDSGYGFVGFSSITKSKELLCGTLKLDMKTSERLGERAMYRRNRRNKLRYRQPRFNNRKKTEGWLAPSVQRRVDSNKKLIEDIKKLLPISKVIVEVGNFDIQKINNPEILGIGYQHGDMLDYQNVRSYLISREHGLCQLCGKKFSKDNSSHIHHIIARSNGGTNRPTNLALLHEKCHKNLHKNNLCDLLKANKSFKAETFMNVLKSSLENTNNIEFTYGYETFVKRNVLGLEKTHYNDAFSISGSDQVRSKPIEIIQKHRNNRVLQLNRKSFKPSIKKGRSKILPKDLFWSNNKRYICKGMFNKGKYVLYGNSKKKEYLKISDIEKYYNFGSLVWTI